MTIDKLPEKLHAASERARLKYLVLMTIDASLQLGKVTPAKAVDWLKGEGLLSEIETN